MRRLEWVNFWPQKTRKEVLHYVKYLLGRVFMFMLLPQIIIQPIPTHHLKFNFGSYLFIKLHWRLWWLYCLVFRKLMACLTCFQSHSNIWFKKDPSHNTTMLRHISIHLTKFSSDFTDFWSCWGFTGGPCLYVITSNW